MLDKPYNSASAFHICYLIKSKIISEMALLRTRHYTMLVSLFGVYIFSQAEEEGLLLVKEESAKQESVLERASVESCYDDIGCFSLDYPWSTLDRRFSTLPQSPAAIGTQFYLSTRNAYGSNRVLLQTRPNLLLIDTDFRAFRWTVILTHGYSSNANLTWVRKLELAMLHMSDVNLVTCDWSKGGTGINYLQVAANARVVGAEIARLLRNLIANGLASPQRLHLIGQSLGAHVMSYAAANITGTAWLTGLDPAQPGFEGAHPDIRLDPSDAVFVEVIHTNAEPFLPSLGLGIMESVGHVDFFINGGKSQPGCDTNTSVFSTIAEILQTPIATMSEHLNCNHQRASEYYTESLVSECSFWGRRWSPQSSPPELSSCSPALCQRMGQLTTLFPARGSFYVRTNQEAPFCYWEPDTELRMWQYLYEKFNWNMKPK